MAQAAVADTTIAGSPAQPAPRRRHAEILAPPLAPVSAAVARRIHRALLVLALIAVIAQPLSVPAGHLLYNRLDDGTDVYSQWQAYTAAPAPDVLFLGPSESRTDVDTETLSALLSAEAGRKVSVGKIGVSAEQSAFLDVVMYRVMQRPSRPRVVVTTLETPMFNSNAFCRYCQHDPLTTDLWQITDPTDPGFLERALSHDPDRARLVAGWVLPAVANYPSIAGLACPVMTRGRALSQRLTGSIPWELAIPTPCEVSAASRPDHVMTDQEAQNVLSVYRSDFVANYSVSQPMVGYERDMIETAQRAGTKVIFLRPPFHSSIRAADAGAGPQFAAAVQSLAAGLDVPVLDLGDAVPDESSLWVDPLHLNRAGALRLAPRLASALQPLIG